MQTAVVRSRSAFDAGREEPKEDAAQEFVRFPARRETIALHDTIAIARTAPSVAVTSRASAALCSKIG